MKTYAAVPINIKDMDDGTHVRRVLISFEDVRSEEFHGWPMEVFYGTKLLAKDPYFETEKSTHKYILEDDGYTLVTVQNNPNGKLYEEAKEIYNKRRYHVYLAPVANPLTSEQRHLCKIQANSEEEAIKKFHEREELR